MNQEPLQKPTASELEILRVLWERGPSTVREVHEALREKKDLGYTTVLKLLQIMTVKGTVRRNEEQRAHVYEACQPATETKRQLVGDVLQRVFEGSASELMIHALEGRRTSKKELDELRRLLDEYEGEADEQLRELDFAGASEDARLDLVAFPMARRGACGSVCRGGRGLPKRDGALRAGGGRARPDDGIAGHHIHLVATSNESGRADRG